MVRVLSSVTLVTIFLLVACVLSEELYPDKYDNVNVDEILSNDDTRNQYYRCILGTSPCLTPDAQFLKGNLFSPVLINIFK